MLVTVGDRVGGGTYGVHSRFRRVVNFQSGDRLVSVVDSTVGPGPVNIVADGIDFRRAGKLRIEHAGIWLDGARFASGQDSVYRSRIELAGADARVLRSNLPALKHTLLEASSPRSLVFLLDPSRLESLRPGFERALAAHLAEGVERLFRGDVTHEGAGGVKMIAGCGFGLTPSGDDFICGMLLGLHVAGQVCGRDFSQTMETVYRAAKTNNLLSQTFLSLAYEGSVGARLKGLLKALAWGDWAMTRACAKRVISVGDTSGADTLTGLHMTLEKYL